MIMLSNKIFSHYYLIISDFNKLNSEILALFASNHVDSILASLHFEIFF